jgi:hypothetical protein
MVWARKLKDSFFFGLLAKRKKERKKVASAVSTYEQERTCEAD